MQAGITSAQMVVLANTDMKITVVLAEISVAVVFKGKEAGSVILGVASWTTNRPLYFKTGSAITGLI